MSSSLHEVETQSAIRTLFWIVIYALFVYIAVASLITEDALFTRLGLKRQVEFATVRAHTMDRDQRWGEKPVIWLVGSSVIRESFNEFTLREQLPDWGVEKFAFDSGGPVFSWAFLEELDIRPGDRVLTFVAPHHFRKGWVHHNYRNDYYMNFVMDEKHLVDLSAIPIADRIEYSLSSTWPRDFWRYREAYREGLAKSYEYQVGLRPNKPKMKTKHAFDPFRMTKHIRDFRDWSSISKNTLLDEEMVLNRSQLNYDGLKHFHSAVLAAGATPVYLDIPASPEYTKQFIDPKSSQRFNQEFESWPHFVHLSQGQPNEFLDYRHPNYIGRERLTQDLFHYLSAMKAPDAL